MFTTHLFYALTTRVLLSQFRPTRGEPVLDITTSRFPEVRKWKHSEDDGVASGNTLKLWEKPILKLLFRVRATNVSDLIYAFMRLSPFFAFAAKPFQPSRGTSYSTLHRKQSEDDDDHFSWTTLIQWEIPTWSARLLHQHLDSPTWEMEDECVLLIHHI